MTTFATSIARYEAWMSAQLGSELVLEDLERKHAKMEKTAFAFLRATYWRWAEIIFDVLPKEANLVRVLSVGDTHLENFGTWRDVEGRLVWGVNDCDEAAEMPFSLDLIRLAASALLAPGRSRPEAADVGRAILDGYRQGLSERVPFILERENRWLREAVMIGSAERDAFWRDIEELVDRRPVGVDPPARFRRCLGRSLPDGLMPDMAPRTAGTGSLGRPRYIASATWHGGPIVREAKAVLPSAWTLPEGRGRPDIRIEALASRPERSPDPHVRVDEGLVVRRLSPNSRKIELKGDADLLLSARMLSAMGAEIGAIHAADPERRALIKAELAKRKPSWLADAAEAASRATRRDFEAYRA
jgi:hypothetical protein